MVNLGDVFPDFKAETTIGPIQFHEWLGEKWGILFSHPSDFTPVCTTELARVANLGPEFEKRGVKVIALSCDSVDSHQKWIQDITIYGKFCGEGFPYPIIADGDRKLAIELGMLDPVEKDKDGIPLTCRAVFVIGPDKKLRLSMLYPATTGRNFEYIYLRMHFDGQADDDGNCPSKCILSEILRVIDSLQLTEKNKVATPADWKSGSECMVLPTLNEEQAKALFPKGFSVVNLPSGKPYLRVTPQP